MSATAAIQQRKPPILQPKTRSSCPLVAIDDGGDGRPNAAEDGSVAFAGTTSGEDGQTVSISISDGTNTINSSATVNSNSYSVTGLDLSSLGDGSLTITADVDDLAGNSATQATDATADTTPPTVTVTSDQSSTLTEGEIATITFTL